MVARTRKQTRTEDVHARLQADILTGRLRPGQRLKFPDLCRSYETSVGVAREALTRLAEQGLVRSQAHQGFEVTPLSTDDLTDLTDARVDIETLVLEHAIVDGDLAWESRLVAAYHTLQRTPVVEADPAGVSDAWATAHAQFHQALLDGCANRRLRRAASGLRDEAELYRRWSTPLGNEPHRDLDAEHHRLLDAALARDTATATSALREHITHTTQRLLAGGTEDHHAAT
jgi:DNA-binding GntR family transcriptional regulator